MRQFYWFLATLFFGVPAILLSLFAIVQLIIFPLLGYWFGFSNHIILMYILIGIAGMLALPTSFCSYKTQHQVW